MTLGLVRRGSEVVTEEIATALAARHDVLVLQSGPVGKTKYHAKRVHPLRSAPPPAPRSVLEKCLFRLGLDARTREVAAFTRAALPAIQAFAPDIIVAINGARQVSLLKGLQGVTLKARIVVFGHAGIGYDDAGNLHARPDLFVALTDEAYKWARSHANQRTKVIFIPNPISVPRRATPAPLMLPHPVILTVSALSSYKNVTNVIRALAPTGKSYILVGDGEESGAVSDAFSGFTGDFRWIKSVPPEEMSGYYHAADIFCFTPDSQEAFGRVYLEAMAAGLPIVASDDSIRRSIIGTRGVYVDPHDGESIMSGVKKALVLGKVEYKKELQPYKLTTVVSQIEKEFHDLAHA